MYICTFSYNLYIFSVHSNVILSCSCVLLFKELSYCVSVNVSQYPISVSMLLRCSLLSSALVVLLIKRCFLFTIIHFVHLYFLIPFMHIANMHPTLHTLIPSTKMNLLLGFVAVQNILKKPSLQQLHFNARMSIFLRSL